MRTPIKSGAYTATDMRIALSRLKPDSTHGAVPVLDKYDELQALTADIGTHQQK